MINPTRRSFVKLAPGMFVVSIAFLLVATGCEGIGLSSGYPASGGDGDSDGDGDDDTHNVMGDPGDTDSDDGPDCDTENEVVLYLSADDSNSMSSPVLVRAMLEKGQVPTASIRTYEFLNYYDFDYQAAAQGTVSVSAGMKANPVQPGDDPTYNLQIGVRAPDLALDSRRPVNITLSLDNSGSMAGSPIEMVRESCKAIADSLRAGDVISIVKWSSSQTVPLESYVAVGPGDPIVHSVCQGLVSGGSTDLHGGLVRAYQLAVANYSQSRINRVVLMSDGGANLGVTDEDIIAQHADDANGEGIYMIGVGMGEPSNYNDSLMDNVTDAGKGAYVFIDSAQEAQKMFGDRFIDNMEVAARDVRVELTMPPSFSMVEFHGEEYSENPEEVEPQHLAPNDAMIYHQVVGTCDESAFGLDDEIQIVAAYEHPTTFAPASSDFTVSIGDLLESQSPLLVKGDALVAYAEALKVIPGLSSEEGSSLIAQVRALVVGAESVLGVDQDLLEIKGLLDIYAGLI